MRQRICLLALVLLWAGCSLCRAQAPPDYDKTVAQARKLMDNGKVAAAYLAASAAVTIDDKRWEAYAVIALLLNSQGASKDAVAYVEKALARAPEEKKATLRQMAKKFGQPAGTPDKGTASASGIDATPVPATPLFGEARRKYDVLMLIIDDADKAKSADERQKLLLEFLGKSAPFAKDNPKVTPVWLLRAAAALELDQRFPAWEAGQKLIALGADNNEDPKTRKVLAQLGRKGWLDAKAWTRPAPNKDWENSLGMKFKNTAEISRKDGADKQQLFFCLWETRVRDFQAFVDATGYDATEGMWTIGNDGWKQRGHTWQKPGFDQTPLHPVCGVNWFDAVKFCEWLTTTERAAGLIGSREEYRLPTDEEWSIAVGKDKYPWGAQWPPPHGAGNYADASSDVNPKIENYSDGFNRTAPVGSFNANHLGLYDLGGNLWEWCADWYRKEMNSEETRKEIPALDDDGGGQAYRLLRGASWLVDSPVLLSSVCRGWSAPGYRFGLGFRCVLVVASSAR